MNSKAEAILLQLVKALKQHEWSAGENWQLTLKTDDHIPLICSITVEASIDKDKWKQ